MDRVGEPEVAGGGLTKVEEEPFISGAKEVLGCGDICEDNGNSGTEEKSGAGGDGNLPQFGALCDEEVDGDGKLLPPPLPLDLGLGYLVIVTGCWSILVAEGVPHL